MRTCSPEGYDFGIDRYINKIIIPNSVLQRVVEPVEEKKNNNHQPTKNKQTKPNTVDLATLPLFSRQECGRDTDSKSENN